MCTKVKRGDAQKVWRKQIVSSANTDDPARKNFDQPWYSGLLFLMCTYMHTEIYLFVLSTKHIPL